MQPRLIKYYAFSSLVITTMSLIFFIVILVAILLHQKHIKTTLEEKTEKIKLLESELDKLHKDIEIGKEKILIWKKIKHKYQNINGLDLENAYGLMKKIKTRYAPYILNVNSKFSDQQELDSAYNNIKVYASELTLDFGSLTDIEPLILIEDLLDEIPGFLEITNVDMLVNTQITHELLDKIDINDPQAIVKVQLRAKWYGIL